MGHSTVVVPELLATLARCLLERGILWQSTAVVEELQAIAASQARASPPKAAKLVWIRHHSSMVDCVGHQAVWC